MHLKNRSRLLHAKPARLPKLAPPRPLDPKLFHVQEHTLENGLRVRLLPEKTVPSVTLYTFFNVGSRNERPGITGIAHLFEHMMFNGAKKYGPREFDRLLESNGGHSNAYTSNDVTAYYEDFASEALELVFDLESDRMRSLAIAPEMLASEREVVKEERRAHVDNEPIGVVDEELYALAFQAHPYRWPVIGWMGDIESIRREDCLDFFGKYYAPNNANLWVCGDFEPRDALRLIERYYGDIPRGPSLPPVPTTEPEQRGERRSEVRFPAHSASLAIGYKAPAGKDPDAPVLDVMQFAMCVGDGSKLVRTLVFDELIAANVTVDYSWRLDGGLFTFILELNPGVSPEKALKRLDQLIAEVAEGELGERELSRARGMLRSQFLREMATHNGRAHALGNHEVLLGDWRGALEMPTRYAAVDAKGVKRAAERLFDRTKRSVVTLVPSEERAHG